MTLTVTPERRRVSDQGKLARVPAVEGPKWARREVVLALAWFVEGSGGSGRKPLSADFHDHGRGFNVLSVYRLVDAE